jgi:hypothetical protein
MVTTMHKLLTFLIAAIVAAVISFFPIAANAQIGGDSRRREWSVAGQHRQRVERLRLQPRRSPGFSAVGSLD